MRAVRLLLVCAAVTGCAVWGADRWGDAARQQLFTEEREELSAPDPDELPERSAKFPAGPQDTTPWLPRRGSGGDIAVRVTHHGTKDWRVTSRMRLSLRADDPLVETLRTEPERMAEVAYVLPGGYATAQPLANMESGNEDQPNLEGLPGWCTVSQPTKGGRVTVTAEHTVTSTGLTGDRLAPFSLGERVPDGDEGFVPRLPGRWTWSLSLPREWGMEVKGRPDRQTAHSVRFRLTQREEVGEAISVSARLLPPYAEIPEDEEEETDAAPRYQAALSLLALLLALGGTLLGLRRAPGGTARLLRRTRQATVAACLLLGAAIGAVLEDLYLPRWSILYWVWGSQWFENTDLDTYTLPVQARAQGTLLGVLLFALPVLVTSFGYRLRTALPPPPRTVLTVTAPAAALVLLSWVMGGLQWTWPVAQCLLCATLAAAAVLGLLLLPSRGWNPRPRAVPLAAAAWSGVSSTIVLQALPRDLWQSYPGELFILTRLSLVASWLAVSVMLAPWVIALLTLAPPRTSPGPAIGRRLVLGVLVITACLPWWTALREEVSGSMPVTSALLLQLVGQSPGDRMLLGVRVLAPALQLIWLVVTALLLFHLHNTGTTRGHWHPSARASCVLLLVLAASSTVLGAPESWLPYWTTGAALATAWGGGLLLLPRGRARQAARLHARTGATHTRLVAALARALLFAEGRHRFLTSSRATLADTSLPANTWDEKWQSLKEPTAADAARETARLRAAALGSSAGRPAWANGVTATAATALLTLPWSVWTASQAHGYSGVPEAVTVAGGPTCVWLAHGFTYGYLYSWLRGNSPVAKAGGLWTVMTTVQLLLLVPKLQTPGEATTLSVFLLLAQSTVMALGLGLYWEIRLVRRADLLWGHIRNFRRLSSLATPVSAVLVAAIAAAVTVLATAWANDVTAPVETPSPSQSSSPSPSPGASP
ncbi:hypothetical protein CP970_03055 [Streptomyces kanamyceticus]|uniref:Uncharacterized protein n=1 Tax=Streptomyces kanamyceticus TaxID=1967 RepID=A0A5J6G376_STRKN|nr:hypothetical protein CP970_03055 [Streptomyces kanamyceticus]